MMFPLVQLPKKLKVFTPDELIGKVIVSISSTSEEVKSIDPCVCEGQCERVSISSTSEEVKST